MNNKVYEIYLRNESLKRYKKDISESCTFCKKDTETVLHLFFDVCEVFLD